MSIPGLEKNLGSLLEKSASLYGDKKAIQFDVENTYLTYQQLNQKVNQFANVFKTKGLKKGDHVAVMLPNSSDFPVTWLALAKLGAIMIPINTRYQVTDLEYVLKDSDSVCLIIHTDYIPIFEQIRSNVAKLELIFEIGQTTEKSGLQLSELANNASAEFTAIDLQSEDLINMQYTSGTTGFPKGCLLTHEYWLIIGKIMADHLEDNDVFLAVTPFYYMDPQWELIGCLSAGATMVLAHSFNPNTYMESICKYQATISWAIMPTWIYGQPESEFDKSHQLRLLLVGGLPAGLHLSFEERYGVKVREAYGMTEIGPGMLVKLEEDDLTGSGSVGKPTHFRTVQILTDENKLAQPDETGELLIQGPGLFKGYYNKTEETAACFVDGWFRTGDLFKQDDKGYYYFVGRKKDMIRRSGDNISSIEVEDTLNSHPKILSAAVVPVPDMDRGEEIKAFVIPTPDENPETIPPEEIKRFCQERIAKFKIPRYIEYRESFPLTASGKIAKHLLED